MEETLEEKVPVEVKVPDDDQGGIRRRLRDRDLLRKRRAEAEERATNQAESRKRARREPASTPRKKGRPKKNLTLEQEQPEHLENQETPTPVEETNTDPALPPTVPPDLEVPVLAAPVPAPIVSSEPYLAPSPALIPLAAPVPAHVSAPVPVAAQIPVQVPVTEPTLPQIPPIALPSYVSPEMKVIGEVSHGVLIEDLGPDEEEDQLLPQEDLIIDQGGVEEASASVPETIKGFSDSLLVSPQPGNMI